MKYDDNQWYGPCDLTKIGIDQNVLYTPLDNYCLSLTPTASKPTVDYVRRAHDQPVHNRLIDHLADELSICQSF